METDDKIMLLILLMISNDKTLHSNLFSLGLSYVILQFFRRHIMKVDEQLSIGAQKSNPTTYEMSMKKFCNIKKDKPK